MVLVEMRNQLLFGTKRHICKRVRLLRKIRVVPLVGVICITILGIGLWLVLAHGIGML